MTKPVSPSILASQPAVCKEDFLSRSFLWLVITAETVDSRHVAGPRDMPCWSACRSSNWISTSRDRFPERESWLLTIIGCTVNKWTHQILSLARDWSKRVKSLNMPPLWRLLFIYTAISYEVEVHVTIPRWGKYLHLFTNIQMNYWDITFLFPPPI